MSHAPMATDAGENATGLLNRLNIVRDVLMTFAAGVLRHAPAAFLDLDRFVKLAGGERQ